MLTPHVNHLQSLAEMVGRVLMAVYAKYCVFKMFTFLHLLMFIFA